MNPATLDRLKKLLRLSKSPNPHESAAALARAMQLCREHAIDPDSIDLDDDLRKIIHEWYAYPSRLSHTRSLVLSLLTNYFHVEVCTGHGRVLFVGSPTAIEIARYVESFLLTTIQRGLSRWAEEEKKARRKVTSNKRRNWTAGFIYALRRKLHSEEELALSDSTTAIILADQKQQRAAHLNSVVKHRPRPVPKLARRTESALMSGWKEGQATNIRPVLGSAYAPGTLRLGARSNDDVIESP